MTWLASASSPNRNPPAGRLVDGFCHHLKLGTINACFERKELVRSCRFRFYTRYVVWYLVTAGTSNGRLQDITSEALSGLAGTRTQFLSSPLCIFK